MSENKKHAIFFLVFGIVFWIIFALDIEHDRDFWTWMWLLNSLLNFFGSLRFFIKYDREKLK